MRKSLSDVWKVIVFPFQAVWWLIVPPMLAFLSALRSMREEPADRPLGDILASLTESAKPLDIIVPHIEEFRTWLLRSVIWLALGVGASFAFNREMIEFLAVPGGGLGVLRAIDVTESVGVFMKVSLLAGLALALLPISFLFWLYVAPGMRPVEKISSLVVLPFAAVLFVSGMAFAYYVILPNGLPILLNFIGIQSELRPSSYFNFVTGLMFWLGVAFEFPIAIVILTLMRLVKPQTLRDQWRLAVIIIAALAAMITPTVDPVNMLLVMVPTVLLYLLSVLLSYLVVYIRERAETEREPPA